MEATQNFHLDPAIALWVLLPLTLVMLLVGLARHYLVSWIDSRPKPATRAEVRQQRALTRAQLLRSQGKHLPRKEFEARREWLMEAFTEKKYLNVKPGEEGGDGSAVPPNPLDPAAMDGMIGMIKKQAIMFVPQSVLMGWINLFFSGFVLTRLPFPLTIRFKSMMQRGIDTPDMDVTWVSSLSWYFLNLFGLNSVYALILGGDNAADGTRDMQSMNMPMPGAGMPGAPAQDFNKLFNAEKENLELVTPENHRWVGEDVEERLLKFYKSRQ